MALKWNPDVINNVPRERLAKASFQLLTAHDKIEAELRTAAAAVIFILLCDAFRQNPHDIFVAVKNAIAEEPLQKENEQYFNSLKLYIENEIKNG